MKVNDLVPVSINGLVVAQAKVKELGEGTATLVVPATLVVMGVNTSLTDLPAAEEQAKETSTVMLGTEQKETPQTVTEVGQPAVVETVIVEAPNTAVVSEGQTTTPEKTTEVSTQPEVTTVESTSEVNNGSTTGE